MAKGIRYPQNQMGLFTPPLSGFDGVIQTHIASSGKNPEISQYLPTVPHRSFDGLESVMEQLQELHQKLRGKGARIKTQDLMPLLEKLVELAPPGIRDTAENGRTLAELVDAYKHKQATFNQLQAMNIEKGIEDERIKKIVDTIQTTLNTATISAAVASNLDGFGTAWLTLDDAARDSKLVKPIADYFQEIKRPIALAVFKKKLDEIRAASGELLPEDPLYKEHKNTLNQAIDAYFLLVPPNPNVDKTDNKTQQRLERMRDGQKIPPVTVLYDAGDSERIKEAAEDHHHELISAYNKTIGKNTALLQTALEENADPQHALAETMYAVRWGQLAEIIQNEMHTKAYRFFPGFPAGHHVTY